MKVMAKVHQNHGHGIVIMFPLYLVDSVEFTFVHRTDFRMTSLTPTIDDNDDANKEIKITALTRRQSACNR